MLSKTAQQKSCPEQPSARERKHFANDIMHKQQAGHHKLRAVTTDKLLNMSTGSSVKTHGVTMVYSGRVRHACICNTVER